MDTNLERKIVDILDRHRDMTIATLRPDGWPQATTVGYGNDGLAIYFMCGKDSQKAANLARDDRVSITVDDETEQVMQITGLSLAGHARRVEHEAEGDKALALLFSRYAEQEGAIDFALPKPADVAIFRVTPKVISVLDYTQGFGHTDLVICDERELAAA
jgi:PPOX class probable F420-dependent enzyme